jgi:hypothetical protein
MLPVQRTPSGNENTVLLLDFIHLPVSKAAAAGNENAHLLDFILHRVLGHCFSLAEHAQGKTTAFVKQSSFPRSLQLR